VFHKPEDYVSFCQLLQEAADLVRMRLLAYCLMPNHFHVAALELAVRQPGTPLFNVGAPGFR
jgi:hypothetical protein